MRRPFLRRRHDTGLEWPQYFAQRAGDTASDALRRYYAAGTVSPGTPMADVPLVAMDMETTGLDTDRHAIVSLALVPFTLKRIHLAERRYWIVHPPRPLSGESVVFHHITHSDIENAPDLADILPQILEALAGRVVVVHYRNIERPFLDAAVRARLREHLLFPVIDTMELEARRYRLSVWARLRERLGLPLASIRLNDCRTRYGLPVYRGHHALWDALATAELLQAQIAHGYGADTPLGRLWC
jgi:DNA polymerase-3 subunit epsilon